MRGISALKDFLAFGMDFRTMNKAPEQPKERYLGSMLFCYLYDVLVHKGFSWDGKPNPVSPGASGTNLRVCNSTASPARERV